MGEQRGAVRTNISLPRELKARMDTVEASVNWSAVAAQAFEQKLLELESKKEVGSMDDVIARLKAAAELEEKEEYQAGFQAGEAWAKEQATPKQLLRLAEYIADHQLENSNWWDLERTDWAAPFGATGFFALRVMGLNWRAADRTAADDFWESALGDDAQRIHDADFLHGFGDGANAVWEKVEVSVFPSGARIMHAYFRWYANGQPQGTPQKVASESAARSAVLQRYPAATFGPRTKTLHQPTAFMIAGVDEMLYAYDGPQAPGVPPIADILFPAP